MRLLILALANLVVLASSVHAGTDTPDNGVRAILGRAVAAAGGDVRLNPTTLYLAGKAVFNAPDSAEPRSTADD